MITRRKFLNRIGLGAAAGLLTPVADGLIAEALGQPLVRRRVVFFVTPDGFSHKTVLPPKEIRALDPELKTPLLVGPATTTFTWPAYLGGIEAFRSRTLIVDGLANRTGSTHGSTFGALSCTGMAGGDYTPTGTTIDQWLANSLSKGQPRKSILYGARRNATTTFATHFASGPGRAEPAIVDPALLFKQVFGSFTVPTPPGGVDKAALRRKALMDGLRADIKRLQGSLAGAERAKLDVYLASLEEMEKAYASAKAITCKPPAAPNLPVAALSKNHPNMDYMNANFEISASALACGITSVVGVALGGGNTHQFLNAFPTTAPCDGHNEDGTAAGYMERHAKQIAFLGKYASYLNQFREGNGTALDNTVLVYVSENGNAHHSTHERWPLVMIGNAGGKLKTDGRFLRYPLRGKPGSRALADFYITLGTALGVPMTGFAAENSAEAIKGPLEEILA